MRLFLLLALAASACVSHRPSSSDAPFRFERTAASGGGLRPVETTPSGPLGDDPALPGVRFNREIATYRVVRTAASLPDRYVVALVPSNPSHPMLERFEVSGPLGRAATSLGAVNEEVADAQGRTTLVPPGTYFTVSVERGEVRVALTPAALRLLARGGTVSWVDAYRN